ncbi:MAG: EamA family transporter [Lachnospiraceae bacterium]|jgi:transporter family protein|nr:EamA family transporter [Lachnospiraceae bacterium]
MNLYNITINWVYLALLSALFFGLVPVFLKASMKRTDAWASFTLAVTVQTALFLFFYPGKARAFFSAFRGRGLQSWVLLILIALTFLLSAFFFLLALQKSQVSQAFSLFSFSRLLLPLLSFLLLKEGMAMKNWYALFLGLAGLILLLIGSEGKTEKSWLLFGLLSLVLELTGRLLLRRFGQAYEESFRILFESFFAAVCGWILLLIRRRGAELKRVTVYQGFFMAAAGLLTGFAVIFLNRSLVFNAGIVRTLESLALPVSLLTSAALLREKLTGKAVLGMICLTAGLMLPNLI